jgi:hypothetical protein
VHILVLLVVSVTYESLFVHHGIAWLFDEGWPLYAAKRLHEGGVLYRDTFFLFPPGHLAPAWIAHALDPPGIVLARILYAAFNVALCIALYLLGRRLMPPSFALLGALLLALAAPRAHLAHLLFGYRYLVWSTLSLLAFSARLRSGDHRFTIAAGAAAGVALCFRLTPAFAVSCAVGIAAVAADRRFRSWLRDWSGFALGLLLVAAPVAAWLAHSVGFETLWRELVVRIMGLQELQSKAIPEFAFPTSWDRKLIYRSFVPVQYWMLTLMYLGYAAVLAIQWARCVSQRRPYPHALLLAVVLWGGIYFLRTLGRSDEHHLASALPPACLLVAHLASLAFRTARRRLELPERWRGATAAAVCLALLGAWVFLQGTDLYFDTRARGIHRLESLKETVFIRSERKAQRLDWRIRALRRSTQPDDTVLDLTNAPLLHVVTGRSGPGYFDVVTPGTFMSEAEERDFIARLDASPPALVLWPSRDFDRLPSRSIQATAPLVSEWVTEHYQEPDPRYRRFLLVPRRSTAEGVSP